MTEHELQDDRGPKERRCPMKHEICDACETVAHCRRNGCIPIQPAPRLDPSPISHMAATLERCAKQERARLQPEQVVQLRQEQKKGISLSQLAKAFRLSKAGVWSICSFRTRKDVSGA